jgi:hypothetical protein
MLNDIAVLTFFECACTTNMSLLTTFYRVFLEGTSMVLWPNLQILHCSPGSTKGHNWKTRIIWNAIRSQLLWLLRTSTRTDPHQANKANSTAAAGPHGKTLRLCVIINGAFFSHSLRYDMIGARGTKRISPATKEISAPRRVITTVPSFKKYKQAENFVLGLWAADRNTINFISGRFTNVTAILVHSSHTLFRG